MARLTAEQWEQAKADYEIAGLTQKEIAEKYGLSKGTVSDKVRKESWKPNKTELIKERKTNAIIELAKTEHETELLNRTEQAVLDITVADEIKFRLQNDKDMETVRDGAMKLLKSADKLSDYKTAMDILRIQREARLGKQPDTQVNIQNNIETTPISTIFEQ
ncbi:MAG: hypothetical protein KGV56_05555 [Gammaproteobacteria bacterium]|nr:hypothetical protein [Gammaproteobacteria bacterium]